MIASVAGKSLPREVVDQIRSKTDGVPLFVEELTKMVLESGLLREDSGRYSLVAPLPPLAIPSSLQDSLMARLDRLAAVKEVAQLAATLGRAFPYALMHAVCDLDEATLLKELSRLVDAELLYQRGLPPQATYVFKHALIQDAAYQSLLKSTRQRYHHRIARTLIERFAEEAATRPEFVAHHYTEAGLPREAIKWWQRAGQRSMQRSAHAEALVHCRKGLEVLASLPPSDERDRLEMDLQIALANALIHAKGWSADETGHVYARAEELCTSTTDLPSRFRVVFGNWSFYFVRGDMRKARIYAEECLRLAKGEGNEDLLINAHTLNGDTCGALGEFGSARFHLERAISLYGNLHKPRHIETYGRDPKISALNWLGWTLWCLGYPDQALTCGYEGITFAKQTNRFFSRAWALCTMGAIQILRGAPQPNETWTSEAVSLSVEQGFPFWIAYSRFHEGVKLVLSGEVSSGETAVKTALSILSQIGSELNHSFMLPSLASIKLAQREAEQGLEAVAEGLRLVEKNDEHWGEAELYRVKGELLLALDPSDAGSAQACFDTALRVARAQQAKSWELRTAISYARLMRAQGRRAEALELLAPIFAWFTEGFDTKDLREALALLEMLRASRPE
jgi:predicted ATPase